MQKVPKTEKGPQKCQTERLKKPMKTRKQRKTSKTAADAVTQGRLLSKLLNY